MRDGAFYGKCLQPDMRDDNRDRVWGLNHEDGWCYQGEKK